MENNLTYFYNIGDIQANKIWTKLLDLKLVKPDKVYDVHQLRDILRDPKIYSELSIATRTDLDYNPLRVVPRQVISYIISEFQKYIDIKFDVGGSYSRGKSTSGDIDIVVLTEKKESTWEYIKKRVNDNSKTISFIEPYASGSDKVSTLIKVDLESSGIVKEYPDLKELYKCTDSCIVYVKIDIFLSDKPGYMYALLFAIGSGTFNIRMRFAAKNRGYLLNHRGLFIKKNDKLQRVALKDEKALFDILEMTYKTPAERAI